MFLVTFFSYLLFQVVINMNSHKYSLIVLLPILKRTTYSYNDTSIDHNAISKKSEINVIYKPNTSIAYSLTIKNICIKASGDILREYFKTDLLIHRTK